MTNEALLQVDNLTKIYTSRRGFLSRKQRKVRAVDNVNLTIFKQETIGVVGESGCGKTTLGRVIMGLVPSTAGTVQFEGQDMSATNRKKSSHQRDMQMVFQNPYSSFDPRFTVLRCVAEPLVTHTSLRGDALVKEVRQLLEQVGMRGRILNRYTHEFSGGQLQRIAIARALALKPKFIVLDEPTSALDVSVQAQIINLLQLLQKELKLTYLFISHDLSVVRHISDRIAVMYLGKIVELNSSADMFAGQAKHPYTQALLTAVPSVAKNLQQKRTVLKGSVPDASNPPSGCYFHPRCPVAVERCKHETPLLVRGGEQSWAACHLVDDVKANKNLELN
ncbi:ABC transporter ATP-binding protein [Candidatus Leptofilum sp.]|uniref:ABC transporter ATP-binding protein n=1 Tax=Candidatus Leptofilum sp. TaxID=3241576 RepID=UPI003B5C39F9